MFVKYICLLACYCVLSSYCHKLNKTCEGSLCVYLFAGDSDSSLPWNHSYWACKNAGLELLRIESNQTQQHVEMLLNSLPTNTDRRVWIGGRRTKDNEWRFMNGTMFKKPNQIQYDNNQAPYCMYVLLQNDSKPTYYADNCDEQQGNSMLLCQYNTKDSCRSEELHSGDKCYVKTSYSGQSPNRIDWYKGQTYCNSGSDIQGDIAYSYLDDVTSTTYVKSFINASARSVQLWLGVSRKPWLWVTDINNDDVNKPVNYFNWFKSENASRMNNTCIYIDLNGNNKWISNSCNEYLKYFVCMNRSSPLIVPDATPTSPTTVTVGNPASSTDNRVIGSKNTDKVINTNPKTSNNNTPLLRRDTVNKTLEPVYLAVIVIAAVLVVVSVVGLTLFFLIKKRRQTSKKRSDVKDEFDRSTSKSQENDDPANCEVRLAAADDDYDNIDPYRIISTTNVRNNDIEHIETPSGDLYAVSCKQKSKRDDNKNKNDKQKDKENESSEELYAKPNKKRNQDSKTSKVNKGQETTASENELKTALPSSDQKEQETKYTEYFEVPSGEIYARVTKKRADSGD